MGTILTRLPVRRFGGALPHVNVHGIAFRMAAILIPPVVLGLLVLSVYLFRTTSTRYEQDAASQADTMVAAGAALASDQLTELTERAKLAGVYMEQNWRGRGQLKTDGVPITITATNQVTGERRDLDLASWSIGEQRITNDPTIVDEMQKEIGATETIFQRFEGGYLRISTNVLNKEGKRGVFTYLPMDHIVAKTVEQGETYVGRAIAVDQWYTSSYAPITGADGKTIGILYVGIKEADSAARLRGELDGFKLGKSGFMSVFTSKGDMLVHPSLKGTALDAKDANGQTYIQRLIDMKNGWLSYDLSEGGRTRSVRTRVTYYEPRDWYVAATFYEDEALGAVTQLRNVTIGLTAAILVVLVAVIVWFSRRLSRRAMRLTTAAARIAQGDLDARVEDKGRDELGATGRAFGDMTAYLRDMAGVATAVADGDLRHDVQPKSEHDVLGAAFSAMTSNLRELVGRVQGSAVTVAGTAHNLSQATEQTDGAVRQVTIAIQGIAGGAQHTSASAQEANEAVLRLAGAIDGIAAGAKEQAGQVQAAGATATEMAAGVEQVADDARTVAGTSEQARIAARRGAEAVRETVAGMTEIKQVVAEAAGRVEELGRLGERIGAVVETINDVAEQTNLLALNAAIEAARAGTHGRGFAVVADEVRKLAERSQAETKAISGLIAQVQRGTRDAVAAMVAGTQRVETGVARADAAGSSLSEILQAVDVTVEQVTEIAGAARQMAAGAHDLVDAMASIGAVVEQNTAATQEMAGHADEVTASMQSIAAVAEENSAASAEVSSSTEEMSAQMQEVGAQASMLAATAEELRTLVARFRLSEDAGDAAPAAEKQRPALRLIA